MSWQPGNTLEDVEKEAILLALRFFRNNKTHTAKALDISYRTLTMKLAKYRKDGSLLEEGDDASN